ncbi:MAG: hypothetical protein ACC661_02100, partial [Verrucomicrobiales bacterium]
MLRFSLAVVFTFVLTFYYVVYNPGGSCRRFLDQIGMLETMRQSYAGEGEAPAPTAQPGTQTPAARTMPLPANASATGTP